MVNRLYVEKRPGLSPEIANLESEIKNFLNIDGVESLRILNCYDVEGINNEVLENSKNVVFSDPAVDIVYDEIPEINSDEIVFAIEVLPGQFDQRADSCSQCIQLLSGTERPLVNYSRIYILKGKISDSDIQKIKNYLINPVESREASLEKPETLQKHFEIPDHIEIINDFINKDSEELKLLLDSMGLAMDLDDLKFLQEYFKNTEFRNPTVSEIRIIDTYWSDHCRHTTFGTHLDNIIIENKDVKEAFDEYLNIREEVYGSEVTNRPITLMDLATIGAKVLKKRGLLPELDESEEINACSIKIPVLVDGKQEDWVIMFKNETHNHPTEIEPFGGAATCIGGCIRDPLSGRTYVYQAMRVTGGADPRADFKDTIEGKLPQYKIANTAAQGYSSYGNQIGLATGIVAELYHPGYAAKHLECGAVVGAAPFSNIRRERPQPGDVIILLGGRTGRDGIGGATGSSKSHNLDSLTEMASEVQKGNAPEERKLQRLFRNPEVTQLIKRCNDFGAGGVSVAIGELADGLNINLDKVRKKYEGLDGTELAISESQERMAVVVAPEDADKFIDLAREENLEAYPVAVVTKEPRLKMTWNDEVICDLSRDFLNSNGAEKHANVKVSNFVESNDNISIPTLASLARNLKIASRRGLVERFDGSIGAGSILMPFGGKTQQTPEQVMAALLPVEPGKHTDQATLMTFGFDPDWSMNENTKVSIFQKAYNSVISSLAKLIAAGAKLDDIYLSLQEFFERMSENEASWAKPFEALLGAVKAQLDYETAAIGGKDSMSGTFLDLKVPPTLISFSLAPVLATEVVSSSFKEAGNPVYLFGIGNNPETIKKSWDFYHKLIKDKKVLAARAVEVGGIAESVIQMSFGNRIGFTSEDNLDKTLWFKTQPALIVAELKESIDSDKALFIGKTTNNGKVKINSDIEKIEDLLNLNESVLANVYPINSNENSDLIEDITFDSSSILKGPKVETPKVAIPVFPGTNCEYDSAKVVKEAGMEPNIVVINNQSPESLKESAHKLSKAINNAQILFIPGGFSGGDEPEGSGKFIASFLRNPEISQAVTDLIEKRKGLILGICNGFQALLKLGLLPYGKITEISKESPTLTYNTIGRHQSKIVNTKVSSKKSPWLKNADLNEIYKVPVSHGEGRFIINEQMLEKLINNGQIATRYVDLEGNPSMDTQFNPNGSIQAIEGITSPDGRILGKMGHTERIGKNLYQNIPGEYELNLFKSAKEYFN